MIAKRAVDGKEEMMKEKDKEELDRMTRSVAYFLLWMFTLALTIFIGMGLARLYQVWFP